MYRLESRRALPSETDPPRPVGFAHTRCPKCQRVTSYLSFQITPLITCTWSNCGHTWVKSADQRIADQGRLEFL